MVFIRDRGPRGGTRRAGSPLRGEPAARADAGAPAGRAEGTPATRGAATGVALGDGIGDVDVTHPATTLTSHELPYLVCAQRMPVRR